MLVALRSRSGGIVVKIFLVVLASTFALWGIGDIFRTSHDEPLAKVDNVTITRAEYEKTLDKQIEGLRSYLGKSYTPELVKSLGIHQQVFNNMVNTILLEKEARSLGIKAGDKLVLNEIRTNPSFKSNNLFDKAIFLETLRNNRLSEAQYIDLLRKEIVSQLMIKTFTAIKPAPDALVSQVFDMQMEQREANLLIFSSDALGTVPAPTDAELSEFYKSHLVQFAAPEYRVITYLSLNLEDVAGNITLTDKDIKEAYDQKKNDLQQPEKRTVEHMLFANEEAAKTAAEALSRGESFAKVAAASTLLNKNALSLGSVAKKDLVGDAADAVFSLTEDAVTPPVQDAFGWHIYRVTEITPGKVPTLESVSEDLHKELSVQRAQEEIYKIANRLDDTLAGGATLEEAASTIGLKTKTFGPVSQDGLSPEGAKLPVPSLEGFLKTSFSLDNKGMSTLNNVADDTYFVARVDAITPERTKSLDEVHGQAVEAWKSDQIEKRISTMADEASKELRAGKPLDAKLTYRTVTTGPIRHDSTATASNIDLPRELVMGIFSLAKTGDATPAYTLREGERAVAVLKDVIPADKIPLTKGEQESKRDAIRKELETGMERDILDQYFRFLRGKYKVSVNAELLQKLTQ